MEETRTKKNPSRKECEDIIRRILMTEVLEKGKNQHFKNATDFMRYFESLYPASDSLTKQVQRAVRSLEMPKDKNGYFIINKTQSQMEHDKDISRLLNKSQASFSSLDECETLFLKVDEKYKSYLLQLITESITFKDKYVTVLESSNGLIFYTENKTTLKLLIESLLE